MKKLKIAVFHNLPSGGALKALYDNLSFLKEKGHEIDVFTTDISDNDFLSLDEIVDNYFQYCVKRSKSRTFVSNIIDKFVQLPDFAQTSISLREFEKTQKKIADDINEGDYDIVFCEQDGYYTETPVIIKYIKKPLVYYCQQPFKRNDYYLKNLDFSKKTIFTKIIDKYKNIFTQLDIKYAQYAKHILVNSYFSHESVLRIYGKNSQVCYLGINTDLFYPRYLSREEFILSVGVMVNTKGFDFIIRSIGKINKEIRPKLKIVSYAIDENWLNYILNLAKENDVDIEILENVSYEELSMLYNKAKLFTFGSYLEPFGLVSLEALACGTPVVAVKEGGIREIVQHGQNGILLDRDEKTFAEGLTKLLLDDELRDSFSKNGIEYVKNFWTLKHAGQRFEDNIYRVWCEENIK